MGCFLRKELNELFACFVVFLSSTACRSHEAEKHAESPAQFICDICGKAWNSEAYLRTHRNHTHHLRADGTPYVPKYRIQKPKKEYEFYGRREGYGQLMADGRRIRGTKYEAVDGKLKCRSCDKGNPVKNEDTCNVLILVV